LAHPHPATGTLVLVAAETEAALNLEVQHFTLGLSTSSQKNGLRWMYFGL
jgi:hypothetical protein